MKDITDVLVARFRKRRDHGTVKYGKTLLPWDGRNTAEDALEEALDLAVYLQKLVIERAETAELLMRAGYLLTWFEDNYADALARYFRPVRDDFTSDELFKMADRLKADIPRIGVPK